MRIDFVHPNDRFGGAEAVATQAASTVRECPGIRSPKPILDRPEDASLPLGTRFASPNLGCHRSLPGSSREPRPESNRPASAPTSRASPSLRSRKALPHA